MFSKKLFYAVCLFVIIVITVGAFVIFKTRPGMNLLLHLNQKTQTSYQPTDKPTMPAVSSNEFPKLYPGIMWGEEVKGRYEFYRETDDPQSDDRVFDDGILIESDVLDNYPTGMFEYYENELLRNGWTQSLFASGSVVRGEAWGWEKSGKYIVIRTEAISQSPPRYKAFLYHN